MTAMFIVENTWCPTCQAEPGTRCADAGENTRLHAERRARAKKLAEGERLMPGEAAAGPALLVGRFT